MANNNENIPVWFCYMGVKAFAKTLGVSVQTACKYLEEELDRRGIKDEDIKPLSIG